MPHQVPGWLGEPAGTALGVAFLGNDRSLAVSHEGNRFVRLWEPLVTKLPATLPAPEANLHLAATADGRALALCGDRHVQLRRQGNSGAYTADDLPLLARQVTSLAFSPAGKSVAVGNLDGLVQVADVAAPKPWKWRTLAGHRGLVRALAFSSDGKFLASAGVDGTVRLWGLSNDKEVIAPISAANVAALAFAPDGKTLAAAGGRPGSGEIWVWNLAGNQVKLRSVSWKRMHRQPATGLAFTPDGERLASSGQDGQVILHNLASGDARVHAQLAGPVHGWACLLRPLRRHGQRQWNGLYPPVDRLTGEEVKNSSSIICEAGFESAGGNVERSVVPFGSSRNPARQNLATVDLTSASATMFWRVWALPCAISAPVEWRKSA